MTHAEDVGCAATEKKDKLDWPVDLLTLLIPDPAILSISGLISDLNIGSVHPYIPVAHRGAAD